MSSERATRIGLRTVALGYLFALLFVPVGLVLYRTFEPGLGNVWASITTPAAIHAFWLTIMVTAIAVPLNTALGILAALVLVRGRIRGKPLLDALIDLPFAVSPIVVGLSLSSSTARTAGSAARSRTRGSRSSSPGPGSSWRRSS